MISWHYFFHIVISALFSIKFTIERQNCRFNAYQSFKEWLEKKIHKTFPDTESPIRLVAWSDDVPALLRASDAYVLSSNYEGWGRVIIEAMAAGLPVVTTDVGCAGEVLLDTVHGTVVPVDNQPALTQALVELSTDTLLYRSYVQNLQKLDLQTIPGTQRSEYGKQWVATLAI